MIIKAAVDNGRAITIGSIIDQGFERRLSMPNSARLRPKTVESFVKTKSVHENQVNVPTLSDIRAADLDGFLANRVCTNIGRNALAQTPKNIAVAMAITPPCFGMIKARAKEMMIIIIVA